MATANESTLAAQIIARNSALKAERSEWDSIAQQCADYVQPRKNQVNRSQEPSAGGETDNLYNLTAARANAVNAAGSKAWLMEGKWFKLKGRGDADGNVPESVKKWYDKATETLMKEFARSNLYTEIHEMFLDRSCQPCALIHVDEGKRSLFNFKARRFGTYAIAEDSEGYVDTVFSEIKLTARQAIAEFGEENVGDTIRKVYTENSPASYCKKFEFIHAIYPRDDWSEESVDPAKMRIASVYVDCTDKKVVRNSGYPEMPTMVTRYLRWGDSAYGYNPAMESLPITRQVNFIERDMDALGEMKAWPRFQYPGNMEGQIDMSPGGGSPYDPNSQNRIETWGTEGDYDIGLERIKSKEDFINRCFHVDLFQMFSQIDAGKMTAYEAMQRVAEKIPGVSPTFYRLVPEVLNPLLERCFALAYRAGVFGEAPDEAFVRGADLQPRLAVPEFQLTGKLALAIDAMRNNALFEFFNLWLPVAGVAPGVMDNIDFDRSIRESADAFGIPATWMKDTDQRDAERQAQAQAQQAAAAMQMAESGAKAAKDVSQASPEVREQLGT